MGRLIIIFLALLLVGFSSSGSNTTTQGISYEQGGSYGSNGLFLSTSQTGVADQSFVGIPPQPYCGDGRKENNELCDDADFGGLTCGSFGYESGSLSCTSGCGIHTTACTNAEGETQFSGGGPLFFPDQLVNLSNVIEYNGTFEVLSANVSLNQSILEWCRLRIGGGRNVTANIYTKNISYTIVTDCFSIWDYRQSLPPGQDFVNKYTKEIAITSVVLLLLCAYILLLNERRKSEKKRKIKDDAIKKETERLEKKIALDLEK